MDVLDTCRELGRIACSDGIPRRSLYVAIVVGTALNIINQGDVVLVGGTLSWLKIGLTYCVPYAVSTYGAVSLQISRNDLSRGP